MSRLKSGIYVLRYSDDCIKIGMSKNIKQRLDQYRGYQVYAKKVKPLMIHYSKSYK